MLKFDHVTFRYKKAEKDVLKDISFSAEKGSFTAVIGASGSGKSTVFRLLNQLEEPVSGSISVDGIDIRNLKNYTSYMPQQDLLFPWFNVLQNVCLPMTVQKLPKEESKKRAMDMLKQVGLLEWAEKRPSELSGGMRQRASFARTLCAGADLLLLDEPFSALDSITRISLQEWLREQWSELNKTILFITHDVEEALFLAERVLVLTGHPADRMECYEVPLPKERNRDMLLRPEILELKETLISRLRQEASE